MPDPNKPVIKPKVNNTIYLPNPLDPKIKAYSDSLYHHKMGELMGLTPAEDTDYNKWSQESFKVHEALDKLAEGSPERDKYLKDKVIPMMRANVKVVNSFDKKIKPYAPYTYINIQAGDKDKYLTPNEFDSAIEASKSFDAKNLYDPDVFRLQDTPDDHLQLAKKKYNQIPDAYKYGVVTESGALTKPLGWSKTTPVFNAPKQPYKYADPNVVKKQQELKDKGLYDGDLDGVWGPKSQKAYEELQKQTTTEDVLKQISDVSASRGIENQKELEKPKPKGPYIKYSEGAPGPTQYFYVNAAGEHIGIPKSHLKTSNYKNLPINTVPYKQTPSNEQLAYGGFINNDMKNKNKKPLPTYGLGGDLLQTGLNGLKFVGNNAVQMAGGNRPFDYTGAGRHEFDKIDNVASPIYGTMSKALPMAANMVVPGSGTAISLAQQGIGAATDGLQVRAEGGYNNGRVNLNAFVVGAPLLGNFPQHAMGGQMQDPSDKTNSNMLTNFPTGGTHEQNPMGGVNVGNRGLVEQGETKAPLDKGDYIFSDRLKPKGNNRTFAQLSKSIHNKYKDRENDAAATRSMKADLEKLAQEQEAFKAAKQAKMQGSMDALSNMGDGDMFMHGGKLKPYSKFMFPDGGMLPQYGGNTTKTNFLQSEFGPVNTDNPLMDMELDPQVVYGNYNQNQPSSVDPYRFASNVDDVTKKLEAEAALKESQGYPAQKADPWIPLAQSAGDIFALAKSQKPQKDIKLAKYTPELMDYSREREIATKQSHMANQIAQANIRRNASSSGQALSNTVASNAVNNSALMNTLSQSNQAQENINNQMRNQAMLTNNATSNQEQELNMKNKAQLAFMQQQALSNIGANTANFGVDQRKINSQNNTNAIMEKLMNQPDFLANLDPKDRAEFIYTYNQNRIKGQ